MKLQLFWLTYLKSRLLLPEKKNEELDINDNEIKKIISFTKEKLSTKDLSELLSIIYKKPKKFFYSKLIKSIR